jgi:outer membrane lipoprotein-sorting protein
MPSNRAPTRPDRRRLAGVVAALAAVAAPLIGGGVSLGAAGLSLRAEAAAPFGLPELMKTLSQVRAGEATFVERREVSMLDRTLESSGRLSFEAPDTFVRETLRPSRDRMAVTGNTLTLSRGGRSHTMQLDASPEAGVIVEAIRGTLTGNRGALERHFEATVSGTPERWSLTLVPREARLRGQVASIKVRGEQAIVREVDVLLADGDRSVMRIEPVAAVTPKPTLDAARPASRP